MGDASDTTSELKHTALFSVHEALGARMVPFAGYAMPVQYAGILKEHEATRNAVGLFDVSHMGQMRLTGDLDAVAAWLERLTPSNIKGLKPGASRYSVLTTEAGGIVDDLIILRLDDRFHVVVNGARRAAVAAHFAAHADPAVTITPEDRALIAVQGPGAEAALSPHVSGHEALSFMHGMEAEAFGAPAIVTRSGYTGEDGFEISLPNDAAPAAFQALVDAGHTPCGLGARDILRLEAALPLYGQDLSDEISPIEAGLLFVVAKPRRTEGGFLGEARILKEIADGPSRRRVGLAIEGRVPARTGAELQKDGRTVGIVTSGALAPLLGHPVALGLVEPDAAAEGTELAAIVRGKAIPATVTKTPFVPPRTKRRTA